MYMIAKQQGVNEEHMPPYIEFHLIVKYRYESPMYYRKKDNMCRVKVFQM